MQSQGKGTLPALRPEDIPPHLRAYQAGETSKQPRATLTRRVTKSRATILSDEDEDEDDNFKVEKEKSRKGGGEISAPPPSQGMLDCIYLL